MEREKGIEVLKMCLAEVKKSEYTHVLILVERAVRMDIVRDALRKVEACMLGSDRRRTHIDALSWN